jgi:hypothetical protein
VLSPDIPKFTRAMLLHFDNYENEGPEEIAALNSFKENWMNLIGFVKDFSQAFGGQSSMLCNDLGFQNVAGDLRDGISLDEIIEECKQIRKPVFNKSELPPIENGDWENVWTIIQNKKKE